MLSRRALRIGALSAVLAGVVWGVLPVSREYVAQQLPLSTPASEEAFLTADVVRQSGDAPVIAVIDDAYAWPNLDAPAFVTTHQPMRETTTPLLGEDLGHLPSHPDVFDVPTRPSVATLPTMTGAPLPGGTNAPRAYAPPTRGTPPITGSPGGGQPISVDTGGMPASSPSGPSAGPAPDEKGPILGGPKPQVASKPDAPVSGRAPGDNDPTTTGPSVAALSPALAPSPVADGPGGGQPVSAGTAGPDDKGRPFPGGPKPQAAQPNTPVSGPAPGDEGPATAGPVAPSAAPTPNGPTLFNPPGQPSDPVIASTSEPVDDWFSPGHSPGIARIDGPFALDGGTLLFEILGTEPGTEYDQLIVNGDVDLNAGNVVIAFISGYPGEDVVSAFFDLILATEIRVNYEEVDFYFGFFDDPWLLHAPTNLSYYHLWTSGSVLSHEIYQEEPDGDQRFRLAYNAMSEASTFAAADIQPTAGPDEVISPLAIPVPAPLLLMAAGLLLISRPRRR